VSAVTATPGTGTPGTAAGRRRRSAWIPSAGTAAESGFVVPFLVGFVLFMIVPLVYAIYTEPVHAPRIIVAPSSAEPRTDTQTLQSSQFWSGVVRVVIYAAIQDYRWMLAIAFFFATVFRPGGGEVRPDVRTISSSRSRWPAVVGAVMWSLPARPQFRPMVHLANAFGFAGTNFFSPSLILPSIIVHRDLGVDRLQHGDPVHRAEVGAAATWSRRRFWTTRRCGGSSCGFKLPLVRPAIRPARLPQTRSARCSCSPSRLILFVLRDGLGLGQLHADPVPLQHGHRRDQTNLAAAGAVILGLVIVVISNRVPAIPRRRGEFPNDRSESGAAPTRREPRGRGPAWTDERRKERGGEGRASEGGMGGGWGPEASGENRKRLEEQEKAPSRWSCTGCAAARSPC